PAAPAAAPAPAPAAPGGRVTSALPPGSEKALEGSVAAYNQAVENGGNYAVRVNPLRQSIPILEKMKTTDTGPISERINELKSAAQSLGAGPLLGIDPEKIRDFNELKKYFSQYSVQAS